MALVQLAPYLGSQLMLQQMQQEQEKKRTIRWAREMSTILSCGNIMFQGESQDGMKFFTSLTGRRGSSLTKLCLTTGRMERFSTSWLKTTHKSRGWFLLNPLVKCSKAQGKSLTTSSHTSAFSSPISIFPYIWAPENVPFSCHMSGTFLPRGSSLVTIRRDKKQPCFLTE